MCLIMLAYQPTNSEYDLIVTANREEYYVRPTATAYQWEEEKDTQHIIAGRDLQEGGTWLGIDTRRKRFAAITNNFLVVTKQEQEQEKKERHIQQQQEQEQEQEQEVFNNGDNDDNSNNNNNSKQTTKVQKRSRGELVTNFLISNESAIQYSHTISKLVYRGYSLLLMDETGMYCVDNNNNTNNANPIHSSPFNTNKQKQQQPQPQPQPQRLEPGKVYGLTNRQLNCDWPKNIRGRKELETWLEKNHTNNDNNNHHNTQDDNSHNNNNKSSEKSIQENENKNNTQNNCPDTDEIIDHDVDKSNSNSTSIHELHQILFHPTTNKSKNPNNVNKEEEDYNYPDRIATDAFLTSEYYGTRVNTVVVMKSNGEIFFSKQGFGRKGVPTQTVQFAIPA